MTAQRTETYTTAASLGFKDAARVTAALYAGGMPLDQIDAHHSDVAARLLSDAQTGPGRDYARSYDDTARALVADLQADAVAATRDIPEPGSPHPDPFLRERGWQACENGCGVYVRRAADADRDADREAG